MLVEQECVYRGADIKRCFWSYLKDENQQERDWMQMDRLEEGASEKNKESAACFTGWQYRSVIVIESKNECLF